MIRPLQLSLAVLSHDRSAPHSVLRRRNPPLPQNPETLVADADHPGAALLALVALLAGLAPALPFIYTLF